MKRVKNSLFYLGVIGGFSALMYWIFLPVATLEQGINIVTPKTGKGQWQNFIDSLVHNLEHTLMSGLWLSDQTSAS